MSFPYLSGYRRLGTSGHQKNEMILSSKVCKNYADHETKSSIDVSEYVGSHEAIDLWLGRSVITLDLNVPSTGAKMKEKYVPCPSEKPRHDETADEACISETAHREGFIRVCSNLLSRAESSFLDSIQRSRSGPPSCISRENSPYSSENSCWNASEAEESESNIARMNVEFGSISQRTWACRRNSSDSSSYSESSFSTGSESDAGPELTGSIDQSMIEPMRGYVSSLSQCIDPKQRSRLHSLFRDTPLQNDMSSEDVETYGNSRDYYSSHESEEFEESEDEINDTAFPQVFIDEEVLIFVLSKLTEINSNVSLEDAEIMLWEQQEELAQIDAQLSTLECPIPDGLDIFKGHLLADSTFALYGDLAPPHRHGVPDYSAAIDHRVRKLSGIMDWLGFVKRSDISDITLPELRDDLKQRCASYPFVSEREKLIAVYSAAAILTHQRRSLPVSLFNKMLYVSFKRRIETPNEAIDFLNGTEQLGLDVSAFSRIFASTEEAETVSNSSGSEQAPSREFDVFDELFGSLGTHEFFNSLEATSNRSCSLEEHEIETDLIENEEDREMLDSVAHGNGHLESLELTANATSSGSFDEQSFPTNSDVLSEFIAGSDSLETEFTEHVAEENHPFVPAEEASHHDDGAVQEVEILPAPSVACSDADAELHNARSEVSMTDSLLAEDLQSLFSELEPSDSDHRVFGSEEHGVATELDVRIQTAIDAPGPVGVVEVSDGSLPLAPLGESRISDEFTHSEDSTASEAQGAEVRLSYDDLSEELETTTSECEESVSENDSAALSDQAVGEESVNQTSSPSLELSEELPMLFLPLDRTFAEGQVENSDDLGFLFPVEVQALSEAPEAGSMSEVAASTEVVDREDAVSEFSAEVESSGVVQAATAIESVGSSEDAWNNDGGPCELTRELTIENSALSDTVGDDNTCSSVVFDNESTERLEASIENAGSFDEVNINASSEPILDETYGPTDSIAAAPTEMFFSDAFSLVEDSVIENTASPEESDAAFITEEVDSLSASIEDNGIRTSCSSAAVLGHDNVTGEVIADGNTDPAEESATEGSASVSVSSDECLTESSISDAVSEVAILEPLQVHTEFIQVPAEILQSNPVELAPSPERYRLPRGHILAPSVAEDTSEMELSTFVDQMRRDNFPIEGSGPERIAPTINEVTFIESTGPADDATSESATSAFTSVREFAAESTFSCEEIFTERTVGDADVETVVLGTSPLTVEHIEEAEEITELGSELPIASGDAPFVADGTFDAQPLIYELQGAAVSPDPGPEPLTTDASAENVDLQPTRQDYGVSNPAGGLDLHSDTPVTEPQMLEAQIDDIATQSISADVSSPVGVPNPLSDTPEAIIPEMQSENFSPLSGHEDSGFSVPEVFQGGAYGSALLDSHGTEAISPEVHEVFSDESESIGPPSVEEQSVQSGPAPFSSLPDEIVSEQEFPLSVDADTQVEPHSPLEEPHVETDVLLDGRIGSVVPAEPAGLDVMPVEVISSRSDTAEVEPIVPEIQPENLSQLSDHEDYDVSIPAEIQGGVSRAEIDSNVPVSIPPALHAEIRDEPEGSSLPPAEEHPMQSDPVPISFPLDESSSPELLVELPTGSDALAEPAEPENEPVGPVPEAAVPVSVPARVESLEEASAELDISYYFSSSERMETFHPTTPYDLPTEVLINAPVDLFMHAAPEVLKYGKIREEMKDLARHFFASAHGKSMLGNLKPVGRRSACEHIGALFDVFDEESIRAVDGICLLVCEPEYFTTLSAKQVTLASSLPLLPDQIAKVKPEAFSELGVAAIRDLAKVNKHTGMAALSGVTSEHLSAIPSRLALKTIFKHLDLLDPKQLHSANSRVISLIPKKYFSHYLVHGMPKIDRLLQKATAKQLKNIPQWYEDESDSPFNGLAIDLSVHEKVARILSPQAIELGHPSTLQSIDNITRLSDAVRTNISCEAFSMIPPSAVPTSEISKLSVKNTRLCSVMRPEHFDSVSSVSLSSLCASLLPKATWDSILDARLPSDFLAQESGDHLEDLSNADIPRLRAHHWSKLGEGLAPRQNHPCAVLKISDVSDVEAFWKGINLGCFVSLDFLEEIDENILKLVPSAVLSSLPASTYSRLPSRLRWKAKHLLNPEQLSPSVFFQMSREEFKSFTAESFAKLSATTLEHLTSEHAANLSSIPDVLTVIAPSAMSLLSPEFLSSLNHSQMMHTNPAALAGMTLNQLQLVSLSSLPADGFAHLPPLLISSFTLDQLKQIPSKAWSTALTKEHIQAISPEALSALCPFPLLGAHIDPLSRYHPCLGVTEKHKTKFSAATFRAFKKQCKPVFDSQELESTRTSLVVKSS